MSGIGDDKAGGMRWSVGSSFLAATWEPEGLLLTPKTAAAPYGFGFPKRDGLTGVKIDPPFGTRIENEVDECLNQVLINRFPNNKYLDRKEYIQGLDEKFKLPDENPRLRPNWLVSPKNKSPSVVHWPLFYTPAGVGESFWNQDENRLQWIDVPGINRWSGGLNFKPKKNPEVDEEGAIVGEIPYRQFDASGDSLIYEAETSTWYCHWPEEVLYDSDAAEAIFQETNNYRAAVGREPLIREIRGFANTSRMILSEMQRAQVMFHDDEERYRQGYGTVLNRLSHGAVNFLFGGENLTLGPSLGGYSYNAGMQAALSWRNSPPHYANMISTDWDSPKFSTSLDVFGNVGVTITEKGVTAGSSSSLNASYDPPISGKAWSQLFLKRDRWLYAGTCEHRTQYGIVTTGSFVSPIGDRYISPGISHYVYYKGRAIFVWPIYDKEITLDVICVNLGACLYMEGDVLSIRVIFRWWKNGYLNFSSCSRPLHAEHVNWSLGSIFSIPPRTTTITYSCFSFSLDGNTGFFIIPEHLVENKYSWYFTDIPPEGVDVCPMGQRIINFDRGVFSFGPLLKGPNITYTMTPYAGTEYDAYNYTQSGEDTVNITPFIDTNGNMVYMQYEMSHFIEQKWTGAVTYEVTIMVNDTLIFPSGKRLQIKKINCSRSTNINNLEQLVVDNAPAYFLTFLYFNPVTEDVVYAKHYVTLSDDDSYPVLLTNGSTTPSHQVGTRVRTEIYVNANLVKDYPMVGLTARSHTTARPIVKSVSTRGDFGGGALDNGAFLEKDTNITGAYLPIPYYFDSVRPYDAYYCVNEPTYFAIVGKMKIGTYPASLTHFHAQRRFCYANIVSGTRYIEGGYKVGIPVASLDFGEAACFFARYKDRFVTQIYINELWGVTTKNTTYEDRSIIFSNFDVHTEVGLGELTDILPCGVIYD